ncbi:MAG: hypothetical protein AB1758_15725 [Candidatus Eremiobacterota bacterium]
MLERYLSTARLRLPLGEVPLTGFTRWTWRTRTLSCDPKIQGLPPGSLEVTRANGERFVGQRRVCARGGIPLNGWRSWVAPPAHPLPVITVE